MKFPGLVVILIFIHCCSAANRTTVWYLLSNQIYSSSGQYAVCTTQGGGVSSTTLFTTSKLSVSGILSQLKDSNGAGTVISNTAVITTLTIVFTYNSTYSLTLNLPTLAAVLTPATILVTPQATVSAIAATLNPTPSSLAVVIENNKVYTPIGTTWFTVSTIQELPTAGSAPALASGLLITDYVSSSTIAIIQFKDGTNPITFYNVAVRTLTSSITGSYLLASGSGCTSGGRKRSLDHLIHKRTYQSCPSSSLDSSLSSTTLSTLCNPSIYSSSAAATKTDLSFTDAVARATNAINALYLSDSVTLSDANSKFTSGVKFGALIAMASFIFNYIY